MRIRSLRVQRTRGHTLDPARVAVNNDRLQELVRFVLCVALLNHFNGILALLALALDQAVHCDLDALPALVPVHCVVATDDRRDLANLLFLNERNKVLHVPRRGAGRGVATVAKEVDVDVLETDLLRGLEERVQVGDMRVNATIRDLGERLSVS